MCFSISCHSNFVFSFLDIQFCCILSKYLIVLQHHFPLDTYVDKHPVCPKVNSFGLFLSWFVPINLLHILTTWRDFFIMVFTNLCPTHVEPFALCCQILYCNIIFWMKDVQTSDARILTKAPICGSKPSQFPVEGPLGQHHKIHGPSYSQCLSQMTE